MVSRARAILGEHRKTRIAVILVLVLVAALGSWMVKVPNWPEWTGFGEHNLWDVLDLLIVPIALAVVAYFFRQAERGDERRIADQRRDTDKQIAMDDRREAALQAYFDRMAELLLKEKLRESAPEGEVRAVARARTSTALRRLDARRNAALLQFLYESDLIANDDRLQLLIGIDLSNAELVQTNLKEAKLAQANLEGANLQGANLQGANLQGANLEQANLQGANLQGANLERANLQGTNLQGAKLAWANLQGANLQRAKLQRVNLQGAKLAWANLQGANLQGTKLVDADLVWASLDGADFQQADLKGAIVAEEQLVKVASRKGATMPDGTKLWAAR